MSAESRPKRAPGNLHVALAMALGVRTQESDAQLIERVRQLVASSRRPAQAEGLFEIEAVEGRASA